VIVLSKQKHVNVFIVIRQATNPVVFVYENYEFIFRTTPIS